MRYSAEHQDWSDQFPDRYSGKKRGHEHDPSRENPDDHAPSANRTGGQAHRSSGRLGTRIRKLEEFFDREDLSERIFSDRNWK